MIPWTAAYRDLAATIVLLAGLLAATPSTAGLLTWTTGGPAGLTPIPLGNPLAIDPQTPTVLYATSYYSGGVFKSVDAGTSWTAINNGLPTAGLAMAIVVDPRTPSTVYVTTAPAVGIIGGAFKSTDGGASWNRMSNGLPAGPFGGGGGEASNLYQALAIDPQNPSILYAGSGTAQGSPALVYRTDDGGANWALVNSGLAGSSFAGAIVVNPANPAIVYVGTTTGGVFKSNNRGASWASVNSGLTDLFIFSLAIDPAAPDTVYAGTLASGVFRSVDGGVNWAPANNGFPGGQVPALAVDPSRPGTVYASAPCCGIYQSTNSGASWSLMSGSPGATALAISPSGQCLHASVTGGVFDYAVAPDPCAPVLPPPPPTTLVAAVLPSSRAVQVGTAATAFVTILNTGTNPAVDVGIALAASFNGTFKYNTTDCTTNAVTGADNVPVTIAVGGQACYVISLTPAAPVGPVEVAFVFTGINTPPVSTLVGINTLLLLGSATPTADTVALAATLTNDGIVHIPGVTGTGVFAVAVANVGIGDTITVSTNTGAASLPLSISLCETNPTTGLCISPIGATVTTFIGAGATPTFGIFVAGSGTPIPLDPAANRIFVVFARASDGVIVGRTSVAVTTQ